MSGLAGKEIPAWKAFGGRGISHCRGRGGRPGGVPDLPSIPLSIYDNYTVSGLAHLARFSNLCVEYIRHKNISAPVPVNVG